MAPRKPRKVKTPKFTLKRSVSGVISEALEEDVPVNYWIVGSREGGDGWFEADAIAGAGKVVYVSSSGDLAPLKEELVKVSTHGLDSETGQNIWTRPDATDYEKKFGMEPWMPTSQMLMAQYGTREFQMIMEPRILPEFKCFLESKKWMKLLQNSCFDFKFCLGKHGVHLVNLADTMLREQELTAGLNGLKVGIMELARRYPPHRIIRKDVRDQFVTFKIGEQRFSKDMCVYGARDIVLLFDIYDGQEPRIQQWKLGPINELENLTVMCTAEMEYGGVPMVGSVLTLAMTYFDERDEYLQREIMSVVGDSLAEKEGHIFGLFGKEAFEFQVSSAPARLQMFRDELGFDINDVQRETMAGIPHAAGALIAEWTAVDKYRCTYGDAMVQRISPFDGRYHPRFSQLGMGDMAKVEGKDNAATGRYSSNFQQLPQPVYRFSVVKDLGERNMAETIYADAIHQARQKHGIYSFSASA